MGLFNKKQENETAQTSAPTVGKKKKDGMASIFHESVLETVLSEFAANEAFVVTHNGETAYVGILLNTNDIGGISKKANKDEAKGSIIECINSGRMKTLITQPLMANESIIFIPDAITVDAMDEFSLLTNAPYQFCYVYPDGRIELANIPVKFNQVVDILTNDRHVSTLLREEEVEEEDYLVEDVGGVMEDAEYDDSAEDEEMPFDNGDTYESNSYEEEMPMEENVYEESYQDTPDWDESNEETVFDENENYEETQEEEVESEEAVLDDIPEEVVKEAIVRKFYSDDLGLEVSTEPFDSQFLHENGYIPFNENRGEGWLNQYVGQMAKDANTEMRRLHQDNIYRMREYYFKLMAMHCEEIYKELDVSDNTTVYGQMYAHAVQIKAQNEEQIPEMVSQQKQDLEDKWNEKLQQVAEEASRAAQQQYRERYGRQHDEDLYHVELNLRDEVESIYQNSLREVHAKRRQEAAKRLDLCINETLMEISKMYLELLDGEKVRYQELQTGMSRFIDEHRKDDVARMQTLDEELKQSEKATQVMAEYQEKIHTMTKEFDAKRMALESDIQALKHNNEEALRTKDMHMEDLQKRNKELQAQVNELLERITTVDEIKKQEYNSRINELMNERSAWEDKCKHLMSVHNHTAEAQKKTNIISGFLLVVAVVAALAIGGLVGASVGLNVNKQTQQSEIVNEFNQSMDDLNANSGDSE